MNKTLRILMLEDHPDDAELVQLSLRNAGVSFVMKVVMMEKEFLSELQAFSPDLILSDYNLSMYNWSYALDEAKKRYPAVPFILVNGPVCEERALDSLNCGAMNYVMKGLLNRLVPSIQIALMEIEAQKGSNKAVE